MKIEIVHENLEEGDRTLSPSLHVKWKFSQALRLILTTIADKFYSLLFFIFLFYWANLWSCNGGIYLFHLIFIFKIFIRGLGSSDLSIQTANPGPLDRIVP